MQLKLSTLYRCLLIFRYFLVYMKVATVLEHLVIIMIAVVYYLSCIAQLL
jgi:hypothetical protein